MGRIGPILIGEKNHSNEQSLCWGLEIRNITYSGLRY